MHIHVHYPQPIPPPVSAPGAGEGRPRQLLTVQPIRTDLRIVLQTRVHMSGAPAVRGQQSTLPGPWEVHGEGLPNISRCKSQDDTAADHDLPRTDSPFSSRFPPTTIIY